MPIVFARWITAIKIRIASSMEFSTKGTALVSFVIAPVLSLVFIVSLSTAFGAADVVATAYASILVNSITAIATSMAASMAHDRTMGLIHGSLGRCLGSIRYWIAASVVPALITIVMGCSSALCVFLIHRFQNSAMTLTCMALVPVAAVVGAGVGLFACAVGLSFRDPFLIANALTAVLVITAGVVAPLSAYPAWLASICEYMPGTGLVMALRDARTGAAGSQALWVTHDLAIAVVLAAIGLLSAQGIWRAVRHGSRSIDAF